MSFERIKTWRDDIEQEPSRLAESWEKSTKGASGRRITLLESCDKGRLRETYLANEGSTNYCALWFTWRKDRGSSDLMFQSISKDAGDSKAILIVSDVRFAQSPYATVDRNGCELISFMGYFRRDEERIRNIIMALPKDEWEDTDYWLRQKIPYFYIAKLSSDNSILVQPRLANQSEDALDTLDCIKSIKEGDQVLYLLRFKEDNRSFDPIRLAGDNSGNIYILRSHPDPGLTYMLEVSLCANSLLLMKTNLHSGFVFEKQVLSCVELPYHKELYLDDEQNLHLMVWSDNKFLHKILDQDGECLEAQEATCKVNFGGSGFIGTAIGPDPQGNINAILVDEKVARSYFRRIPKRFEYRAMVFPLHLKAKYCRDEYAILGKNLQIIRLRYDEKRHIELSVH